MLGAVQFIEAIFGEKFPAGMRVELFNLPTSKATSIALPSAAAAVVPMQRRDTYISAGYTLKAPPKGKRSAALDTAGIAALWLDIDVNGGPDNKTGAMPDRDAATALARTFCEPTMLVDSGYGVHAWWVLREPWIFTDDLDRRRAARAVQLWQAAHRTIAKAQGAKLDSTHDLARLMRLPGTVNGKGGLEAPVTVFEHEAGRTFSIETLLEASGSGSPGPDDDGGANVPRNTTMSLLDAPGPSSGDGITVEPNARPPQAKFEALLENSPDFHATWTRQASAKTKAWSHSEWDFSLASQAAHAGWTPQEVADLIVASRSMHDPTGNKASRPDYIGRTVERIFDSLKAEATNERMAALEASERRKASEQAAAVADLADLGPRADAGEDVSIEALDAFNAVLACGEEQAPRVIRIEQYGTESGSARYTLYTADGKEIAVNAQSLYQSRSFAIAVMAATGHVMGTPQAVYWQAAIRVLLRTRVIHEAVEIDMAEMIAEAVQAYTAHGHPSRSDEVVAEGAPFYDGDEPRFTLGGLQAWLGRRPGMAFARGDVAMALRKLGWIAKPVTFKTSRGAVTSKSYYGRSKAFEAQQAALKSLETA